MKRAATIFLFLLSIAVITALQLGLTSAACATPSQTILTLYQNTNSHVAVYNSSYNDPSAIIPICYDAIFGTQYTGAAPWSCSGTNTLLKLSSINNAHAENASLSDYPVSVCYGDLSCHIETGNGVGTCTSGNFVLSISGQNGLPGSAQTNSHLSIDGSYPYYLCCTSNNNPSQPGITLVQWRNSADQQINQAPFSQNVKLFANTPGLDGKVINFTIYNVSNGAALYRGSASAQSGSASISGLLQNLINNGTGLGTSVYFNASYYNASGLVYQKQSNALSIIAINVNMCSTGNTAGLYWYDGNGNAQNTSLPNSLCLVDGVPDSARAAGTNSNDCCASGNYCSNGTASNNGFYSCSQCPTNFRGNDGQIHNILLCNDYNNLNLDNATKATFCRSDSTCARAVDNELAILNSQGITNYQNPACEWVDSEQSCVFHFNITSPPGSTFSYGCAKTYVNDAGSTCSNESTFKVVQWVTNLTVINLSAGTNAQIMLRPNDGTCPPSGQTTVPCSRSIVALPFFDMGQLVIALALIAIIYVIIFKTGLFKKKRSR